ncbi:MAG: magnesium transporter [Candidatus Micrarchaeia archaeon]|jgi:magnesium transporter
MNLRKKHDENINEIICHPKKRISIFKNISVKEQGFILLELSKRLQKDILNNLTDDELFNLIEFLDPDEITEILHNINSKRSTKVLKRLNIDTKEKIEFLLKFDPKTIASMVSFDYIRADSKITFEELSKEIQQHEKNTGKFPVILIFEKGELKGEIFAHTLALVKKKEKIEKYINKIHAIKYNESKKEVIKLFEKYQHNKIVVLDENDSILGIIYSDDILKLIRKQSGNSLREFAGISEEEDVLDSAFIKFKYRYKWLILNLATAFFAASIVSLFQETISAFVLLAVYMPIVAGMGGNAGTQTLAVVVRGLALKEIELKTGKRVIINEALAGAMNGIVIGILVAAVALFWNHNPILGLILSIAMICNLITAGFFGAVIPLIMKKLGKDPASSATIFITTATDVFGFFVFLGLATLLL